MILDIGIAVLIALAQAATTYLGWRVTLRPPEGKKTTLGFEIAFALALVIGISGLGFGALRANLAQGQISQGQLRIEGLESKNALLISSVRDGLEHFGMDPPRPSVRVHAPPNHRTTFGKKPQTKTAATELHRRNVFLSQLRTLWIATHDGISPAMMAGLEWPPEDWLNLQLAKYGQDWRVRVHGPQIDTYAIPEDVLLDSKGMPFTLGKSAFSGRTHPTSAKQAPTSND